MPEVDAAPEDMGEREVVVVGSGFGGAVAACRLAQAGCEVMVLERGRRYGRGEDRCRFPRDRDDPWFWGSQHGPFDVRPFGEVVLVQAAGYGGGSLLYSNVHLRLPPEGFDGDWPAGWTREVLDPYYDLVAHMLELRTISESEPRRIPDRTVWMETAAARLGRGAQSFRPPLALTLTAPDVPVHNRHGVEQVGCTYCAECSIGCNVGAKNSLDHNYLAVAERAGAEMKTSCEVTAIARDGSGYRIDFRDREKAAADPDDCRHGRRTVWARTLVLAAGTANTTELLLRHRDELRVASQLVGERYSANGDFLAAGLDVDQAFRPDHGPAITAGILYAEGPAPGDPWFLVQDGGFPPQFTALVMVALRTMGGTEELIDRLLAATGGSSRRLRRALERFVEDVIDRYAPWADDPHDRLAVTADHTVSAEHAAVLLAMGRDSADGTMRLRPWPFPHPWVDWAVSENERLYATEQALCDDLVAAMRGSPVHAPGWRSLRWPLSVHNLGGAVMGRDPEHGVVDPHGEVFGCPGLFVVDGAAIPSATGVNPSHTIAAVAERNVERLVRRLTSDPMWRAPERSAVTPHHDPLPRPPAVGTTAVRRGPRVRREVRGHGELAAVNGLRTHAVRLCLVLTGEGRGDATGPLLAQGELRVAGLGRGTETVRLGRGVVLPDPGEWTWRLPFSTGPDQFVLEGWSTRTELRLALHRGTSPKNHVIALGTLEVEVR